MIPIVLRALGLVGNATMGGLFLRVIAIIIATIGVVVGFITGRRV